MTVYCNDSSLMYFNLTKASAQDSHPSRISKCKKGRDNDMVGDPASGRLSGISAAIQVIPPLLFHFHTQHNTL